MKVFAKILAAAAVSLVPAAALATPITGGMTVNGAPVTYTPTSTVASNNSVAFASAFPAGGSSTFTGTYSEFVYRDSSNTLCATAGTCLTFVIQVSNSASSRDGIETVTTGPFSSAFTYNVGYSAGGSGIAPVTVSDSGSGAMAFSFTPPQSNILNPGMTSDFLVIQSSATSYTAGNLSFQDNQTATVSGFIPATAVTPEPSSLMLLGTGLMGAAGTMLRRRRNAA